jgi:hypothetical protein
MMKNESQPEIKIKLFASLIRSRCNTHTGTLQERGTWNFKFESQVICHYTGLASVRNTALLCWRNLEVIK